MNCVVSGAGGEALARLDFHEGQRAAAADDQIDLAAARADVPRQDRVSAQTVEPCRAALAAAAELRGGDGAAPEHRRREYLGRSCELRVARCERPSQLATRNAQLPPVKVLLDIYVSY